MNKPRVYASSDWHGCWDVAKKVLDYLQPEDILYFLGDSTDRGPDGIKILQALIQRPNTFYIKGNHDEMFREALPYIRAEAIDINEYHGDKFDLWYGNGGQVTGEDLLLHYTPDQMLEFIHFLNKLPTELRYRSSKGHTVIMEHAGYTPFDIPHRSHDPLWDREHFHDNWVSGSGASEIVRDTYLIHGHTPVQYLKYTYGYNGQEPLTKEEMKFKYTWYLDGSEPVPAPTIIRYCDGHKFDVDMCTVASNRIALLDLDTFEEIYFDKED